MFDLVRCDAHPDSLDNPEARQRSHAKTDFLISSFSPGVLWDDYGIRADVTVDAYISCHDCKLTDSTSLSPMNSLELKFMNYSHLIYSTKS